MAHTCTSAIVHCIDFRLQKAITQYLQENNMLGDCDIISIAGAVKNTDFIIEQVALSKKLHDIKQVVLINHTDCGAYGGSAAFANSTEEKNAHAAELKKTSMRIMEQFPDLKVIILLAEIAPDGNVRIAPAIHE